MKKNSSHIYLENLITLQESTTKFLESIKKNKLQVQIKEQFEEVIGETDRLIRKVILYFESSEFPLLYCESWIEKSVLTTKEYALLIEGKTPIGSIFTSQDGEVLIAKSNFKIESVVDSKICQMLNINLRLLMYKQYDYHVGNRFVGKISEYFNEESLNRK